MHFNGSVALAFALGGHRSGRDSHLPNWQFDSAVVEAAVADFMGLVLTVGLHVGSGEYEVRIGIEHGGPEQMIMQTADTHGFAFTDTSIPMHRFTPVEATATAADDEQYFHQVRALIQDCVNQGGITNLRITDLLTRAAAPRQSAHRRIGLRRFRFRNGLAVLDPIARQLVAVRAAHAAPASPAAASSASWETAVSRSTSA